MNYIKRLTCDSNDFKDASKHSNRASPDTNKDILHRSCFILHATCNNEWKKTPQKELALDIRRVSLYVNIGFVKTQFWSLQTFYN